MDILESKDIENIIMSHIQSAMKEIEEIMFNTIADILSEIEP